MLLWFATTSATLVATYFPHRDTDFNLCCCDLGDLGRSDDLRDAACVIGRKKELEGGRRKELEGLCIRPVFRHSTSRGSWVVVGGGRQHGCCVESSHNRVPVKQVGHDPNRNFKWVVDNVRREGTHTQKEYHGTTRQGCKNLIRILRAVLGHHEEPKKAVKTVFLGGKVNTF